LSEDIFQFLGTAVFGKIAVGAHLTDAQDGGGVFCEPQRYDADVRMGGFEEGDDAAGKKEIEIDIQQDDVRVFLLAAERYAVAEPGCVFADGYNTEAVLLPEQGGQRVQVEGMIAGEGDVDGGSRFHGDFKLSQCSMRACL